MKKTTCLLLMLCATITIAQDYRFGKVSKEELQQSVHPNDANAAAAILNRSTKTKFVYTTEDGFVIETDVVERVKIYNSDGYEYATIQIPAYIGDSSKERISGLKAYTYNIEGGKVEESKLKRGEIFEEETSRTREITKFTMPDIKDGSVIEYKYTFSSPFVSTVDEFRFQEDIPVDHVEMEFFAPEYLSYRTHGKGTIPLNIRNSQRDRSININYTANTAGSVVGGERRTRKVDYVEMGYSVVLNNVKAMREEPYSGNINNFMSGLQFELAYTKYPDAPIKNFATTWDDVAKRIYDSDKFGGELERDRYFDDDISNVISEYKSEMDKAQAIYDFVRNKITWNEYSGVYCDVGVRKAYKEGSGSVADMNLMLTAMMRYAGLDSNPVLISSKKNGIPFFPTLSGFNYVVSGVTIGGKDYLFDATDAFGAANVLRPELLNWNGRLVKSDGTSRLVNLYPPKAATHNNLTKVSIDEDLFVQGISQNRYSGHYGYKLREALKDHSDQDQIRKLNKFLSSEVELASIESKEMDAAQKPLSIKYDFESDNLVEEIGAKLYITPLLHLRTESNTFKAEERKYPIDFGYPTDERFTVTIDIPEGYKIESIPEALNIGLANNMGSYSFGVMENLGKISIVVNRKFNIPLVPSDFYSELQKYFDLIVEKENEKIVLSKA